jgi:hypothetical protein
VNLTTSFWNPRGGEVAGTWFDTERAEWRVSTVAVRGFRTEREAIAFYHSNCDSLTGMLSMRHRAPLKSKALVRPAAKPSLTGAAADYQPALAMKRPRRASVPTWIKLGSDAA